MISIYFFAAVKFVYKLIYILFKFAARIIMYYLIKGTVTQIEKALINDCLRVSKKVFLKSSLLFNSFYCLFCLQKKLYVLNNLKTRTVMNAKIWMFFICIETIIICYEIICMTVPQPRGQRHFLYVCNLRKVKVRVVHPATYNFSISTACMRLNFSP